MDAILDAVQDLPNEERGAYLDRACEGDATLRRAIEHLLRSEEEPPAGFLENSALEDLAREIAPSDDRSGRRGGGYRLLRLLGSGGMGDVYLAEDERLGRQVAIKILPGAFASDPERVRRFEREARAVSSLNHPNILTLHDVIEMEGSPCLVLEFVEGENLRQRIQHGRLPPTEAIDVALQIAAALSAAHQAGFVHRDIKPENVMLRRDGLVKVLDFGLAKLQASAASAPPDFESVSGLALGTTAYMSPEQSRGGDVDARSDLYSLGLVLNEMVADRPPGLARVVERLLRSDRVERYASGEELARDLKDLQRQLAPVSPPAVAPARRPWVRLALGALAAILAVALGLRILDSRRVGDPSSSERDTVLLGEFENATGDPLFDDTLGQALAVYLEQSPHLSLFPDEGVRQTLRFMQKPADQPLQRAVALEVCERNGIKALITGRVAALGSRLVVTLEAVRSPSGVSLGRALAEADSRDHLLAALQRAAADLRSQLGESLASIREFDAPLEQATTASLEALRDFALARHEANLGRHAAAIPLLQKAVERDPSFASAYAHLATAYRALGNNVLDRSNAEQAYALRDRVSEREALFITQQYESFVLGDLDQTVTTLRRWRLAYPRDHAPGSLLASNLELLGRFEEAAIENRATLELSPNDATAHTQLGIAQAVLGRRDEAQATLALAEQRGLSMRYLGNALAARSWLDASEEARRQEVSRVLGTPQEAGALNRAASWSNELGQARRSTELAGLAIEAALRVDRGLAGRYGFEAALRGGALGQCESVASLSRRTLELTDHAWAVSGIGVAQALCGRDAEARRLIERLAAENPRNTLIQRAALPATMAILEMNAGRFDAALSWLDRAAAYEGGTYAVLWPVYLRGLAHARAGHFEAAAGQFQRVIDNEGLRIGHTFAPSASMALLQLARTAAAAGDPGRARRSYEELLRRWAGADPDLPPLAAARSELSSLTKQGESDSTSP